MAKKLMALLVVSVFAVGMLPSFAADDAAAGSDNLITKVDESIKDYKYRDQDKVKTAKTVPVFQNLTDYIKEGSQKAKGLSKRKAK